MLYDYGEIIGTNWYDIITRQSSAIRQSAVFFSLNTNHAHKQTPTNRIHLKKKKKISQIFRILNRKKNLQKIIIIITRELAGGNENLQISSAKASVLDNIYTLDNI